MINGQIECDTDGQVGRAGRAAPPRVGGATWADRAARAKGHRDGRHRAGVPVVPIILWGLLLVAR